MQDLIKQEQFECEVLDQLNSARLLTSLVFCGGTMLRLCYGLNRYSVDLDFWVVKDIDFKLLYKNLNEVLAKNYRVEDAANKRSTLLFEIKAEEYPRSLKIEIRKEQKKIKTANAIAFSTFSTMQVMVRTVSLGDMMAAKIDSLIDRRQIRDAFDLEFLLRRGIPLVGEKSRLLKMLSAIESFKPNDYKVKLGSLLEAKERRYYNQENFKLLKLELQKQIMEKG